MVKLNKIYTRTGDGGRTKLGDGVDVPKHSLRVEAYGTVDEANAAIGVCVASMGQTPSDPALRSVLIRIQNELFDVGADLCVPVAGDEKPGVALRMTPAEPARLEALIDEHNERLEALSSFVLPGGTPAAAGLHLARTVVRRAERLVAQLCEVEPKATNPEALVYLNRLSDLLFVLARVANDNGRGDVLWKPGDGRTDGS